MRDQPPRDGPTEPVRGHQDLAQERRIREVFDARDWVRQVRRESKWRAHRRAMDHRVARTAYREALEDYITDLEPLMVTNYPNTGDPYWTDEPLGSLTYDPTDHLPDDAEPDDLDTHTVEFVGLRSLLEHPTPYETTITYEEQTMYGSTTTATTTVTVEAPWSVLDAAYRHANAFLAEIGLDLDPDDSLPVSEL